MPAGGCGDQYNINITFASADRDCDVSLLEIGAVPLVCPRGGCFRFRAGFGFVQDHVIEGGS